MLLWDKNIPKVVARKLDPRWIGPFTILRRTSAYVYEILYKGKPKIVHARRLLEYHQYLLPDWETKESKSDSQPKPKPLRDPEDGSKDDLLDLNPKTGPGMSPQQAKKKGLKIGKF